MIKISNLKKSYGKAVVIDNFSFVFPDSGLFFFTGVSGCGKSTMLNILGGVISDYQGTIEVNSKNIASFTRLDWAHYRNSELGIVYQDFNLVENESVYSNLQLCFAINETDNAESAIFDALKRVDLIEYANQKVRKLSGGQKQRVAIARAIIKSPLIILADEPTGNLDSDTSSSIFQLLKEISKESLVIVATHDTASAQKFGEAIISLEDGTTIYPDNNSDYCSLSISSSIAEVEELTIRNSELPIFLLRLFNKFMEAKEKKIAIQCLIEKHTVKKNDASMHNSKRQSVKIKPLNVIDGFRLALTGLSHRPVFALIMAVIFSLAILFQLVTINLITYDVGASLCQYSEQYNPSFFVFDKECDYYDSFLNYHSKTLTSGKIIKKELEAEFGNHNLIPQIKSITLSNNLLNNKKKEINNVSLLVLQSDSIFQINIEEGRLPQKSNEITLTNYISNKLQVKTGDNVLIDGESYNVVGIVYTDCIDYNIDSKIRQGVVSEYGDYKLETEYLICFVCADYIITCYERSNTLTLSVSDVAFSTRESMIVDSEMAWGKSDDSLELLYGRIPENDKEIAISHHTAIRMGLDAETELPYKSFFVDLSKPMYGDAFSDSINLSSVFENGFEIVGVFEDNDFDAAFFSDTFETVKKDYYDYYIFDGYFVQNDNNATAKNFNRLLEANIRWKDVSARLMYDFKTSVNELKSYEILALVFFATLFCGICILYISSNIKGKSKLIGIYKSLGFSDADQQLVLICEAFIVGLFMCFFRLCFLGARYSGLIGITEELFLSIRLS